MAALCNGSPQPAGGAQGGAKRGDDTFGDATAAQLHLSSGDTTPSTDVRLLAAFPPAPAPGGAVPDLPGGSPSGDTSRGVGGASAALAAPGGAEVEHPRVGNAGISGEGGCSPARGDCPPVNSQAAPLLATHPQPQPPGDPFLVAAAGAVAAAASGRASAAWRSASAAERVALLGRRWYGADYPTASSGADAAQAAAAAPAPAPAACPAGVPATFGCDGVQHSQPASYLPPAAFAKPPRLILRTDGSTVAAPPQESSALCDGGDVSVVPPRAPRRRPSAAQLAQAAAHDEVAGRPLWSSKALAPLLHYPIPPHRGLAACAQRQALPAQQQQQHSHARVPTAPRSRTATARRASWNASTIGLHSAAQQQQQQQQAPPSHLDAVLNLTRRGPGGGASQGSRVHGPGAGLPGSAHAKAAPPSFAFELLPQMVPLSRHNVKSDMRAIAAAAEALFAMQQTGDDQGLAPAAKRMRLVSAA